MVAAVVAALGVATAIGHSLVGERAILRALYAEPRGRVLAPRTTRAVLRAVFHMPSVAWAVLGIAVLLARVEGGNRLVSLAATVVFGSAAIGNLLSLRRPHPGGLMMLAAALLTLVDAASHSWASPPA